MSNKEKGGLDLSGQDKCSQDKCGQEKAGQEKAGPDEVGHVNAGDRSFNAKIPAAPRLEPLLQAHIGKQLREMFETMAREPVPDRFRSLLDRLEAGEQPAAVSASQPADDEAGAK